MVRIARRETIEHRTGYQETYRDETVIVGGVNHDALSGDNRRLSTDHQPLASCRCIADKCAMWRWSDRAPNSTDGIDRSLDRAARRGYCGLAGRPELA